MKHLYEPNVAMKTRDGVTLMADVWRPLEGQARRSAFTNVTLEDINWLTDRAETIYSIDTDPQAVPPPADRTLVGR